MNDKKDGVACLVEHAWDADDLEFDPSVVGPDPDQFGFPEGRSPLVGTAVLITYATCATPTLCCRALCVSFSRITQGYH
jgi:hypothetical protein